MENTFWNTSRDVDFVELFKKTFTLYVESGMRKKMEADLDVLVGNQGGYPRLMTNLEEPEEFKVKFCKIIIGHSSYLCKFHCSYLYSTFSSLTNFFSPKYSPSFQVRVGP